MFNIYRMICFNFSHSSGIQILSSSNFNPPAWSLRFAGACPFSIACSWCPLMYSFVGHGRLSSGSNIGLAVRRWIFRFPERNARNDGVVLGIDVLWFPHLDRRSAHTLLSPGMCSTSYLYPCNFKDHLSNRALAFNFAVESGLNMNCKFR